MGIIQETPGFIISDGLPEKVWVIICHDELTANYHAIMTLFLHQHCLCKVLVDIMHHKIVTEDDDIFHLKLRLSL
jgi:hypothetical protein